MTDRAWLTGELGAALVFAVPTSALTWAGAQHVTYYGGSAPLYVLVASVFWGPSPLLAAAVVLQSRPQSMRIGWKASVAASVGMMFWSALALRSFARQGDVDWSLWAMWLAAAAGALVAGSGAIALAPSRRSRRDRSLVGSTQHAATDA